MSANRDREEEIFNATRELAAHERAAYLAVGCGQDADLRQRIEGMLEADAAAGEFFKTHAAPSPTVIPADASLASSIEKAGDRIGRYKLLQQIGEGGCGVVYMAEQEEPVRRRVALKVIKLGMDTEQVIARFEAERRALALMDHPNIAKVLDAGATETGRPYFVMELVRGIKITEFCDENKLSTADRLKLFMLVCQAIQHAHQKGVIHRDIKPSNILITINDGVPVPKVIDFGIAKATAGRLTDQTLFTAFEQFIGTPAYMSPEQAVMTSLDIDTRSDIYSLGVLLYELLVGQTPFDAKEMIQGGLDALRQIIREKEPLRPSTKLNTLQGDARTTAGKHRQTDVGKLVHQLQGDLDWIVMKCLEKDRTRRYETANGLAADIQRHLANEPVIARPPSAAYRLQKAWQRNKVVFTAGVVVTVALVAGIGVSTWQAIRATRATKGEFEQRVTAQTAQRKASESEQRSRRLLYASDMNLAQQALKASNLGRTRRLLDRHRPKGAEEDLRGWEWRYLWQLTHGSAPVTLTNRPTLGFSVSFSPDGSRLAVGWYDGRVDLWDVPGRRWIRALTDRECPHPGRVAFSPVRNLLAATSEPGAVTLYDLDSGRESILWRAPNRAEWNVRDLSFSQDGSRLVIYAGFHPERGDAVWVMNVASSRWESRHVTGGSQPAYAVMGAARISPDNQRLYMARSDYLNGNYSIKCIDLSTGQELWQTESQRDFGPSTLDISPDGRVLASGSAFYDTKIHIWDAATGDLLKQLDGHTAWVCELAFTRDGRRLISAAADQTIRLWDTSTWNNTMVVRGHTDEVWALALSEPAQLIASASRDGDLMLWRNDEKHAADGYRRLPESLGRDDVQPLDHSRVLLLPPGQPPELVDLKRDSPPVSLSELGSSTNVLGYFGANLLCLWNGINQILVGDLRGAKFVQRAAITLDSGLRPTGFTYNPARQLLAWTEESYSNSVFLASLAAPGRRIELKSDIPGLVPFRFSEDGNYLAARGRDPLRAWNVETGHIVASINQSYADACFAANGRVLVVATYHRAGHEIGFYDLTRPDQVPRRFPGKLIASALAVSPYDGLVAASTHSGPVRLFDPAMGELESLHGHLTSSMGIAFSLDGSRLASASWGREAVKLWDVGTRQELLTLAGLDPTPDTFVVKWSADGDVIFAGPPWQAWSVPSWEEIAAAEAKEKSEIKQP